MTELRTGIAAGRETTRTEWGIRHSSGAVRWPNEESCRHHAAQHGGTVVSRQVTTITTEWEEATDAAGRETPPDDPATACDACSGPIPYQETCYAVPNGEVDGMFCVRVVCAGCYRKGER